MTDHEIKQGFQAIHELIGALRNSVRPQGPSWMWDGYFNERLAQLQQVIDAPTRAANGKFNARPK
jgi:hypothetical protein